METRLRELDLRYRVSGDFEDGLRHWIARCRAGEDIAPGEVIRASREERPGSREEANMRGEMVYRLIESSAALRWNISRRFCQNRAPELTPLAAAICHYCLEDSFVHGDVDPTKVPTVISAYPTSQGADIHGPLEQLAKGWRPTKALRLEQHLGALEVFAMPERHLYRLRKRGEVVELRVYHQ